MSVTRGDKRSFFNLLEHDINENVKVSSKIVGEKIPHLVSKEEKNSGRTFVVSVSLIHLLLVRFAANQNVSMYSPSFSEEDDQSLYATLNVNVDENDILRGFFNKTQDNVRISYQNLIPYTTQQGGENISLLVVYNRLHPSYKRGSNNFDIEIFIEQEATETNLKIEMIFSKSILLAQFADIFINSFVNFFYQISLDKKVYELELLTEEEKMELLQKSEVPSRAIPSTTLHEYFDQCAERFPDRVAVTYKDQNITYSELRCCSNQLARQLRERYKLQPGEVTGVLTKRSIHAIVAMLGILKAECIYLPINEEYPKKRKKVLLEDASVKLLLSEVDLSYNLDWFDGQVFGIDIELPLLEDSSENLLYSVSSDSLAYLIFTSGSTGSPKGVAVHHKGALNMILDLIASWNVRPGHKVMQFAAMSFDASIYEIFMALMSGATLVIFDQEVIADPKKFLKSLDDHSINVLTLPPSYLNTVGTSMLSRCTSIISLITAGEEISPEDAQACASFTNYYNAYGPTECSVCVSYYHLKNPENSNRLVPIGKPIANTRAYILDEYLRFLPVGMKGEIFITGPGLAAGYLNNVELTSEKFVELPFLKDDVAYRTGDFGAYDENGDLVYLGRKNSQVKIRGFRVELFEIEHVIMQCSGVDSTIVIAEDEKLSAHILSSGGVEPEILRTYLADILPTYMVPHHFFVWNNFPVNSHGKIDRKKLMARKIDFTANIIEAQNSLQRKLQEVWSQVLNREAISIKDNFFHIGGDSLQAIRLFDELDKLFPDVIQLSDLFTYESIETLSAFMSKKIENASV